MAILKLYDKLLYNLLLENITILLTIERIITIISLTIIELFIVIILLLSVVLFIIISEV